MFSILALRPPAANEVKVPMFVRLRQHDGRVLTHVLWRPK